MKHVGAQTGENCSANVIICNASKCKDVLQSKHTRTHTKTQSWFMCMKEFFSLTKSIVFGCFKKLRHKQKKL